LNLLDPAATRAAGAALGRLVQGGDCIALIGDLGAGKTTFTSGLVEALGASTPAASPTFSLVNEYVGGRLIAWHVDLYRIEREAELRELGLEEMLGDRRGVCVVEWAEKFDVMPRDHLRLELAHAGDTRTLSAIGTGPRGEALAAQLTAACT
jgi:tRNA threonylcarbamoyladenosine biosynthesis protein TsaE